MAEGPVYCLISGCTPEILQVGIFRSPYDPVRTALEVLGDRHEVDSQDDFCVIGPIHLAGYPDDLFVDDDGPAPRVYYKPSETNILVLPHRRPGKLSKFGYGLRDGQDWYDRISSEDSNLIFMVQTYALDIMALATQGRLTPLRLWRLANEQDEVPRDTTRTLQGVDYGPIPVKDSDVDIDVPNPFPGFSDEQLRELKHIEDDEVMKEWFVHEGQFWGWMAPDRFPVIPTQREYITLVISKAPPLQGRSTIENLPLEMLGSIVSFLPLRSLLHLATASRQLRSRILGNGYFACLWMYVSAPWWIPVPTQTPRKDGDRGTSSTPDHEAYPASEWGPHAHLAVDFPVGLDWAYVGRCMRSGSMRNRRRIWKTVLDIERVACLAGL